MEDGDLYEKWIIDPELPSGYKKLYHYYDRERNRCQKKDAFYGHVFVFDEKGICVNDYGTFMVKHSNNK